MGLTPKFIWPDAFTQSPTPWEFVKDGLEGFLMVLTESDPILEGIQDRINPSRAPCFDRRIWKLTANGIFFC